MIKITPHGCLNSEDFISQLGKKFEVPQAKVKKIHDELLSIFRRASRVGDADGVYRSEACASVHTEIALSCCTQVMAACLLASALDIANDDIVSIRSVLKELHNEMFTRVYALAAQCLD